MKNKFICLLPAVFLLTLTGCNMKTGIPSPGIARVEVLNEESEPVKDCVFSAVYNGNPVADFFADYEEYSDEAFAFYCEGSDHIDGFINGKTFYEIGSNFYTELALSGVGTDEMFSNSEFTVSREGYVSQKFTLSVDSSKSSVAEKSVVLVKATE